MVYDALAMTAIGGDDAGCLQEQNDPLRSSRRKLTCMRAAGFLLFLQFAGFALLGPPTTWTSTPSSRPAAGPDVGGRGFLGASAALTEVEESQSICALPPNMYGSLRTDELMIHSRRTCRTTPDVDVLRNAPIELTSARSRLDDEALIQRVAQHQNLNNEYYSATALMALRTMRGLSPAHVLALRETWTEADTEVLRSLDARAHGFVPEGELTTEAFARRLPSVRDLNALLAKRSIAIVGSGKSLEGGRLGDEIDGHPLVARFNGLIGSALTDDTGSRTNIHVMNKNVIPLQELAGVAHFDLEWVHPWSTYCKRLHALGAFANLTSGSLYVVRPTALCALGEDLTMFTRGFLFYWFVGRSFEDADMYGFAGRRHYRTVAGTSIGEPFLNFEHIVYREAQSLDANMTLV